MNSNASTCSQHQSNPLPPGAKRKPARASIDTSSQAHETRNSSNTNSEIKAKSPSIGTKKIKKCARTSTTGLAANASTQTRSNKTSSRSEIRPHLVFTRDIGKLGESAWTHDESEKSAVYECDYDADTTGSED